MRIENPHGYIALYRMDYIYQELLDTVSQVDTEEHMQLYSNTFGIDMDYAWPEFEVGKQICNYYIVMIHTLY